MHRTVAIINNNALYISKTLKATMVVESSTEDGRELVERFFHGKINVVTDSHLNKIPLVK